MPTSTRTTMAVCTLAAAWAVGTGSWAQQPGASQAATEPPVGEYAGAQSRARLPLEQILERVRQRCQAFESNTKAARERRADQFERQRSNPQPAPRSQVGDSGLFRADPREVAEQERESERLGRQQACSPTEDEARRLRDARCGDRSCTEPMPAVQASFAARVAPGWLAAVEVQAREIEPVLRQLAAAPACAAPLPARARAVAASLARWEEFAKLVNAPLRPAEQACFALCAAMAGSAVQLCEGDAAARRERQHHWQRTREQLVAARATVPAAGGPLGPAQRPCACRPSENPPWLQDAERALRLREELQNSERAAVEASRATRDAVVGAAPAAAGPEAAAAAYRRGYELYMRSDFKGALPDLKEAVRLDPESVTYNRFLGEALRRGGDGVAALPYLERALAKAPMDAWLHMGLAQALALAGRKDSAIRAAEQAAALWPENEFIRRDRDQLIRSQR